jgi:hypothetical protein
VERAKVDIETVARKATLQLFQSVIDLSPVGNPDTWKSNEKVMYRRETHNVFVDAINADIAADPKNFTRTGKQKVPFAKKKTIFALRAAYPLAVGRGYVGGRFRANCVVSQGEIDRTTSEETSRAKSDGEAQKALTLELGGVIYLTNSLPYAQRLEHGWSKQAPTGMVRKSAVMFKRFVRQSIR